MKKIIATNDAPAAIGPYSQAVELNGTLFISGQIPVNPATGEMPQGIEAQTRQVLKNIGAILEAVGTSFDHVIKTTCFLADMSDFAALTSSGI